MTTRIAGLLLGGALIVAASAGQGQAQGGGTRRPNVVLILTDDVGYGDLGRYGVPDVEDEAKRVTPRQHVVAAILSRQCSPVTREQDVAADEDSLDAASQLWL